eukprot:GHVU01099928.1.p1 GENE.GHVU01099928.1~~GHVU01099928.1.p1  ORF type:complete len:835 (+),score=118.24 GHVU01099928.1:341-2506(+)
MGADSGIPDVRGNLDDGEDDSGVQMQVLLHLFVQRRFDLVSNVAWRILVEDPLDVIAAVLLGLAYTHTGNVRSLLSLSNRWASQSEAMHRWLLGCACVTRCSYGLAEGEFRAVVEKYPSWGIGCLSLASVIAVAGEVDAAMNLFRCVALRFPESPLPHHSLGTLFAAIGNHSVAARHFHRALIVNPSDPVLLHELGVSAFMMPHRRAEAVDLLHRAAVAWRSNGVAVPAAARINLFILQLNQNKATPRAVAAALGNREGIVRTKIVDNSLYASEWEKALASCSLSVVEEEEEAARRHFLKSSATSAPYTATTPNAAGGACGGGSAVGASEGVRAAQSGTASLQTSAAPSGTRDSGVRSTRTSIPGVPMASFNDISVEWPGNGGISASVPMEEEKESNDDGDDGGISNCGRLPSRRPAPRGYLRRPQPPQEQEGIVGVNNRAVHGTADDSNKRTTGTGKVRPPRKATQRQQLGEARRDLGSRPSTDFVDDGLTGWGEHSPRSNEAGTNGSMRTGRMGSSRRMRRRGGSLLRAYWATAAGSALAGSSSANAEDLESGNQNDDGGGGVIGVLIDAAAADRAGLSSCRLEFPACQSWSDRVGEAPTSQQPQHTSTTSPSDRRAADIRAARAAVEGTFRRLTERLHCGSRKANFDLGVNVCHPTVEAGTHVGRQRGRGRGDGGARVDGGSIGSGGVCTASAATATAAVGTTSDGTAANTRQGGEPA